MRLQYRIPPEEDGSALRDVLRRGMGLSASLVKAVKRQPDGILLDGQGAHTNARVRAGQVVSVAAGPAPAAADVTGPAPAMPPVLYEDEALLIVNKPAGMAVHPTAGIPSGTLYDAAAAYLGGAGGFCPVSRLDRHTSGVLCAAKNRLCAQRLSAQLAEGGMGRVYRAILAGDSLPEEGVVDAPIGLAEGERLRRSVCAGGQRAVTHYRILQRAPGRMLAELRLETGRTHQIRVHMAHLGCPVAGDFLYGGEIEGLPGFALHAFCIRLKHPVTGEGLQFSADPPPSFWAFWQRGGE